MLQSNLCRKGFPRTLAGCRGSRALALALGLALCGVSCSSDDDDDDSSSQSNTSITIKEEHDWSSDDNDYSWESPGPTAKVNVEIDDFHHGDFLLTIIDSTGDTIFSKLYWSFDWYWYLDGEFEDIDFTQGGEPGLWTILLEFSEFTGDVKVIVETTESQPPEPVVPDPDTNSDLVDKSFGDDGRATYEPDISAGRRVAVDSSGRIVACGTVVDDQGARRLTVWRYTAGGDLDGSFGDGGVRTYESSNFASGALDVAIDANNRILVSGWTAASADRHTDLALLLFTTAGNLDTSFSSDGIVTFDDGQDEAGIAVAVDTVGRVLVAGTSRVQANPGGHLVLLRFTGSGTPDSTFDGDGIVRTSEGTDRANDLALASGDQPVVLGSRDGNLILWKFTSGGALDGSFGSGGVVASTVIPGEFRVGAALAFKDDGTLGVAGVRFFSDGTSPPELALWRYLANGSPIGSFGGSGFLSYRHSSGWAAGTGIRFDLNGRLLVCGVTKSVGSSENDASATLWRYFPTGSIDTALPGSGNTGVARFDPRSHNAGTSASSLALLGDGKVLVSGSAFSKDTNAVDLVIWRLKP